jgi:hypothetical protein
MLVLKWAETADYEDGARRYGGVGHRARIGPDDGRRGKRMASARGIGFARRPKDLCKADAEGGRKSLQFRSVRGPRPEVRSLEECPLM